MGRWPKHKSDRPAQNSFRLVIRIFNRQKDLKISKGSTRTLIASLLNFLNVSTEEISLYFVTEKEICKLHEQFFQDPSPTDCISFPIDQSHLGEIFVCPKVAVAYAKKRGLDPHEETSLYIVHGILHLLGFDDLETQAKRRMRKKEKSCMRHLYEHKVILRAE